MDVTYLSCSVPQTPWWLSLNRWVFSWYKSAELSWDSFISTKNTAQNIEFISHASDCQTASLAERTIISTRKARNTWKIVLELDFWQPEARADAPHQPLSISPGNGQGQELFFPLRVSCEYCKEQNNQTRRQQQINPALLRTWVTIPLRKVDQN